MLFARGLYLWTVMTYSTAQNHAPQREKSIHVCNHVGGSTFCTAPTKNLWISKSKAGKTFSTNKRCGKNFTTRKTVRVYRHRHLIVGIFIYLVPLLSNCNIYTITLSQVSCIMINIRLHIFNTSEYLSYAFVERKIPVAVLQFCIHKRMYK